MKGKENHVVDAVRKTAHEIHVLAINMYMTYLKDKIPEAVNSYQHYLQIKKNI
jgi:hypothetical protein